MSISVMSQFAYKNVNQQFRKFSQIDLTGDFNKTRESQAQFLNKFHLTKDANEFKALLEKV